MPDVVVSHGCCDSWYVIASESFDAGGFDLEKHALTSAGKASRRYLLFN